MKKIIKKPTFSTTVKVHPFVANPYRNYHYASAANGTKERDMIVATMLQLRNLYHMNCQEIADTMMCSRKEVLDKIGGDGIDYVAVKRMARKDMKASIAMQTDRLAFKPATKRSNSIKTARGAHHRPLDQRLLIRFPDYAKLENE